jgi:SSS family solute:Na+ symporter
MPHISLDLGLFLAYIAFTLWLGFWVARRQTVSARDYFLAGERLPWYAIGGSIIAANISTEHFVGMVGAAYAVGFVLAQWEWGNWITFSALIWLFLPYYLRGGIYTMPEFLERRYNRTCRYIFAAASLLLWIVAQMAVVMLAGSKVMEAMFSFPPFWTILILAALAGSYTIYGGLVSVAWIDFMQFVVLMTGGLIVAFVGLDRVGGIANLMHTAPAKFKFIYPATDPDYPWFGVYTLFFSIGIWYNCTNQFIVQRCLGARSEWDARMGVVFAGFMKILLPLIVVMPGIVASRLLPGLPDPDMAYPKLVKELIPAGLGGIVMAAIASALLSHLSSVLNSSSTVFTMDLYKPLISPEASNSTLIAVGRWSGVAIMMVATLLAIWFSRGQHMVFTLIQNVGAWIAAPISVVFLAGVLWRRATAAAATFVLFFGFPYTWFVESVLFRFVPAFMPFNNWLNRTFVVWVTCIAVMVVISLATRPPAPEQIEGMIWSRQYARIPASEAALNSGARNLFLWWALFVGAILILYGYLIWFQFWGPGSSLQSAPGA